MWPHANCNERRFGAVRGVVEEHESYRSYHVEEMFASVQDLNQFDASVAKLYHVHLVAAGLSSAAEQDVAVACTHIHIP